jgi:hypothetical protein
MMRSIAREMLSQEARGLLTRVERLTSFALRIPVVAAAEISNEAQAGIERFLTEQKRQLRGRVHDFLTWLEGPGASALPAEMQRRFTLVRLSFGVVLEQFEIFSGALTQRSEHGTGVWLAGLDAVAYDALRLEGDYYETPPVICYLDRGIGAAIRRVRTRLPGGQLNPVAIIRVPRERMVGSGIASSLIHEVGHQGAALLGVMPSLREAIRNTPRAPHDERAWMLWRRWSSEIIADFWSVATLGVCATMGLINVVSLPRFFMFRNNENDPHPIPWIRVKLSCAMGARLHPDPQWSVISEIWEALYPKQSLSAERREELEGLERTIDHFVEVLVSHVPHTTRGRALKDALPCAARQPATLRRLLMEWQQHPERAEAAPPSLVFGVLGQARADGLATPDQESQELGRLLTHWALQTAIATSAGCRAPSRTLTA